MLERSILQAVVLCEAICMIISGVRILRVSDGDPVVAKVKPVVVLLLLVCMFLTFLVSIVYWETPTKWPFIFQAVLLIMSDISLLTLNRHLRYGQRHHQAISEVIHHSVR